MLFFKLCVTEDVVKYLNKICNFVDDYFVTVDDPFDNFFGPRRGRRGVERNRGGGGPFFSPFGGFPAFDTGKYLLYRIL